MSFYDQLKFNSDDLIPAIEAMELLSTDDKRKILRDNAIKLFPRLKVK